VIDLLAPPSMCSCINCCIGKARVAADCRSLTVVILLCGLDSGNVCVCVICLTHRVSIVCVSVWLSCSVKGEMFTSLKLSVAADCSLFCVVSAAYVSVLAIWLIARIVSGGGGSGSGYFEWCVAATWS
jgi:hypothetical protein